MGSATPVMYVICMMLSIRKLQSQKVAEMSDIGGRHSSKWDPPERNKSPKDLYDSARTSRTRSSFHDRDVPRRHLPNDADVGMHSRRTSLGRKDFQMDETLNERSLSRDRDGKYTARISPSRDERRQRNRSRSPRDKIRSYRDSRSRSRSHSPGNGYRHEQIEGSRNRGGLPQSCRDFTAGRCRRGNHCQFSHSDQSYDRKTGASKYSSASSRYAQYEVTSDRKGSMDVMVKDGDNDRRRRDDLPGRSDDNDTVKDRDDDRRRHPTESGWSNDREHSRSGDLICKFFAAGRCRHGKYCRHSHNLQEVAHPDGARASDHNFDGANQAWKGATWDDPMSDVAQAKDWPEEKKEILDVTKPGDTAWKSRVEPRMPRNNLESVNEVWRDAVRDDTVGHVSQSNGGPEGNRENLDTMRPTQRSHMPENNLERANEAWHDATWNDNMGDVSQAKDWPEGNGVSFDTMNPNHMLRVPNHNPDVVSREWQEVRRDDTLGNASEEKGWLERKGENLDGMKLIRSSRPESDSQNMDLVSKGYTAVAVVPSGELASNDGKLPHQWKLQVTVNDVGATVLKGAESSFSNMGNLASGGFGQQGLPISRPESVLLPHAYVHSRQLEVAGHSTTEKQYAAADSQPRVFDQPYSKMPTSTVGVSSAYPAEYSYHGSYASSNTSTGILPGQGGGYTSNATIISGLTARGVDQPAVSLDPFTETSHISKNLGANLSDAPYMASGNLLQHALSQSPVIPEQLLAQLIENKDLITKLYAAQQGTSDGISGVPNTMSSEMPQESSHFSITQAQNFVNNTQVPVPYAASNQHGAMESLSTVNDSMASVQYASARAFESGEKQYDPLSDSVDPKQLNTDGQLLSIEGGVKSSVHQSMVSTFAVEPASTITASGPGHDLSQAPVVRVERNGSPIERNDEPVENGPTDEMAVDAGADDGKKVKEAKGLRVFKFALAEFVKELLKPTWKEGHIGKEVYKTIVKKVVDKVLDTVQAAHIPQTKEKIDHYLSLSKPKLSKLVQAYVEKYQKS